MPDDTMTFTDPGCGTTEVRVHDGPTLADELATLRKQADAMATALAGMISEYRCDCGYPKCPYKMGKEALANYRGKP